MSLYGGIALPGCPDYENVRKLDQLPIPMIRRMMRLGVGLDIPYCHGLTSMLEKDMSELRVDIACEIPPDRLDEFVSKSFSIDDSTQAAVASRVLGPEAGFSYWSPINVESGDQIARLFYDVLNIGKNLQLKKTKGGDRISTGKKQLELLKKEHPVVELVLRYRERSKLRNTYTLKLPKIAVFHPRGKCCPVCELPHIADSWRVHTEILTTRTDTGRLASKNPNLQNIPARTELGRLVRQAFIPTPGHVLVACDYAQIELRLLAHCSQDPVMIQAFRDGLDIHLVTAMHAFGITNPLKVDKLLHRAPCKNVNFGIVYGLTESGLYDLMAITYATAGRPLPPEITPGWCGEFIRDWFGVYREVEPYMEKQYYRARRYGCTWTEFGRTRLVPEVKSVHKWIQSAGLRQAGNAPIQGTAADVMKVGMARVDNEVLVPLYEQGVWAWPLLPIHDELLSEVEEDYAEYVLERKGEEMGLSMTNEQTGRDLCRVPICSDGKVMDRWRKE